MALIGPRQFGKTTLARGLLAPGSPTTSNSEIRRSMARARALQAAARADRPAGRSGALSAGGSALPSLLREPSESLAGRIEVIETGGFTLDEVGTEHTARLW